MPKLSPYFPTDPTWALFARQKGIELLETAPEVPELDISQMRIDQVIEQADWISAHPLSSVGYESHTIQVPVRDGSQVELKISRSTRVPAEKRLPLLFVCHGGGWIRGTHASEEIMLLGALYEVLDLVIVSVDYRRIPDVKHPVYLQDCWDAFTAVQKRATELGFDQKKIWLAGSSVGGQIVSVLSQWAKDEGVRLEAVILNVPVLCDPRHFPVGEDLGEFTSYEECFGALLNSAIMRHLWKLTVPDEEDAKSPVASPLLGNLKGSPKHFIYVAGQDPVRDEGIAYARKLERSAVGVKLRIYAGVPHVFGEFWETEVTRRFWKDIREDLKVLAE